MKALLRPQVVRSDRVTADCLREVPYLGYVIHGLPRCGCFGAEALWSAKSELWEILYRHVSGAVEDTQPNKVPIAPTANATVRAGQRNSPVNIAVARMLVIKINGCVLAGVLSMPIDTQYKTTATASGAGRDWKTALANGAMSMQLTVPKELGGPGGDGANPEILFALGYSACFLGAMRVAAARTKINLPDSSTVTATIGVGPRAEGGFGFTAALDVYLPGLQELEAKNLVETTHGICPYSNAIKASIDVATTTRGSSSC
jgi:osmotically inducible protein OsmC